MGVCNAKQLRDDPTTEDKVYDQTEMDNLNLYEPDVTKTKLVYEFCIANYSTLNIPIDIVLMITKYFDIELSNAFSITYKYDASQKIVFSWKRIRYVHLKKESLDATWHDNKDEEKKNVIDDVSESLKNEQFDDKIMKEDNEQIDITDDMNHTIERAMEKYKLREEIKYRCLLLGAGEVGKTTILKQWRHQYGRKFDQSELLAAKPHLTQNTIEAMRTLAIYSDILGDQGKDTHVQDENREIRNRVRRMNDRQKFTKEHCQDLVTLWQDKGIQNTIKYNHQFVLIDTYQYILENMDKYWRDDYIPTIEDIVHSYQRTTGANKIKFVLKEKHGPYDQIYEIFDTGGLFNMYRFLYIVNQYE